MTAAFGLLAVGPFNPPSIAFAVMFTGEGIALAALALCAGFLAFYQTSYRGASELGLVAAAGMVIGVLISLTTLPAMLLFTRPKPEPEPAGYAALTPLDSLCCRRCCTPSPARARPRRLRPPERLCSTAACHRAS